MADIGKSKVCFQSVNLQDGWTVVVKTEKRMANRTFKKVTKSYQRAGFPFQGFESVEIAFIENNVVTSNSYKINRKLLCPIDPHVNYKPQEEWYTHYASLLSSLKPE
ncbi:hypothetical protein HDV01_005601 [Terramyces sp. JEL0728]|nr:hypothetical protein HDV01_005601 [Terramyces sp. JEL0728]